MIYPVLKVVISALIILAVSELSKRSSFIGGLLASLPLVSLLAMIWLYRETHDAAKVAALSISIFWLVLPSLVLFVILPILLKRQIPFYPALGLSILGMLAVYALMIFVLNKAGVKL
jgi:F0F1-type ATP synthase assembly protein I